MNRLITTGGASVYPLTGDVESQAGNPTVTVVGINGIQVDNPTMYGGEVVEYNVNTHTWTPTLRAAIQVNNVTVSDDYIITVNVAKIPLVNGS